MIDKKRMLELMLEADSAKLEEMDRQENKDIIWTEALTQGMLNCKRQAEALERIAVSLEKIAGCVRIGRDGNPLIKVSDDYQEWRANL